MNVPAPAYPEANAAPRSLLILGGTEAHRGGVETFCERAEAALRSHARERWTVSRLPTDASFLSPRSLPRLARAIGRFLRAPRPALVWLQYTSLPDLLYILPARLRGLPVLVTPHLGTDWRSQKSPRLRKLSNALLGRATRLALLSASQEAELTLPALPRSRICTFLPQGAVDAAERQAPPPGTPLRLVHAARLSRGKGTFRYLELLAELRRRDVPFTARLIGRADARTLAEIEAEIERLDLRGVLQVDGWMDEAALLSVLRDTDVLVHLSAVDSYPLILLEAMACGAVPVALDLPGAQSMISDHDGTVVSGDGMVRDAAAWIATLDPADIRARGAAVGERVRATYGWPQCVGQLESAIDAALGEA